MENESLILDLIFGFKRSKLLFAAAQLGLYDILASADTGSCNVTLGSMDSANTCRILNALVSLGVLSYKDEGIVRSYSNTDFTQRHLLSTSLESLRGIIGLNNNNGYVMYNLLDSRVRFGQKFENGGTGFKQFYDDEAGVLQFARGMHSFASLMAPQVLTKFDLSKFKTFVDLGGGTGALMSAACEIYPECTAYVVDLPNVISSAQKYFTDYPYIKTQDVKDRLKWTTADIFNEPEKFPEGDLFVLSRILHDWDEENCKKVLSHVYNKLPQGGGLLVCESLLNDDGQGPLFTLLGSITMFLLLSGKERSVAEYSELLESVGFTSVSGTASGGHFDAILAIKT